MLGTFSRDTHWAHVLALAPKVSPDSSPSWSAPRLAATAGYLAAKGKLAEAGTLRRSVVSTVCFFSQRPEAWGFPTPSLDPLRGVRT